MRKWVFAVVGVALLAVIVIIFFADSSPRGPVTFMRYETNANDVVKAFFSVSGYPLRRYVTCNRVEQRDAAGVLVYVRSGHTLEVKRGEMAIALPGSRLATRVIFDVWEKKFSDGLKQLVHGVTAPSPGLPLSGPHYFVTNNLPAR